MSKTGAAILILALAAAPLTGLYAAEAALVIDYPSISPDGDGIKDLLTARMTLSGQVDTLRVTIEDLSPGAVHDTIFDMTGLQAGQYEAVWDGTDAAGTLLPEGQYALKLYEHSGGTGTYLQRTVIIDLTAPSIAIDRIEPGIFSPGFPSDTSRVDIYYIVTGFETGLEGEAVFTSPDSATFSSPFEVSGEGENLFEWSPLESYPSGLYGISLTITDYAGNSASDDGSILLDTQAPSIGVVTQVDPDTREAPDAITGYCYDSSGIREGSTELVWGQNDEAEEYYETGPFAPADTWTRNDTLFWTFDVPDSVDGTTGRFENSYTLKASCYDAFDRFANFSLVFRQDRTPPAPPVINNAPGKVVVATLELDLDYEDGVDSLFIYRRYDGNVTESRIMEQMAKTVDLEEGVNEIWVKARDRAGNIGEASQTLVIEYSTEAGLEFPEVFRGPDDFQIVTTEPAMGVVIHIYDMAGDHVRRLDDWSGSTVFILPWDLLNDDGETVRNGPYVMVLKINHYDGTTTVEKDFIAVVKD